jgi:hypothetical protein
MLELKVLEDTVLDGVCVVGCVVDGVVADVTLEVCGYAALETLNTITPTPGVDTDRRSRTLPTFIDRVALLQT